MPTVEDVLERAIELVEPSEEEKKKLSETASALLEVCRRKFSNVEGFVEASVEGSAAKDTWLRSKPEIDVFIHFSPATNREAMEKVIIELGAGAVQEMGGRSRLRYAEHPYVEGFIDNITVNIVGCYEVPAGKWISAVDRTPHHTRYVVSKLTPRLKREVRLLKGFLTGTETYGAEIRVGGFSGYLSELLIIHSGGFLELLKAASGWRPPVVLDIEGRLARREALALFTNSPLIVVDPVDKNRNVASAVTLTKLSEFILASKIFLENPSISFFTGGFMHKPHSLESLAEDRELFAVMFRIDEYVPPDVIWGELRRSAAGIKKRLELAGFNVYNYGIDERDGSIVLVFELDKINLPSRFVHRGPPVWMRDAIRFVEKYLSSPDTVAGPWVEGERLCVLKKREVTSVDVLLKKWISKPELSITRQLNEAFISSKMVAGWREVINMLGSGIHASFLARFLSSRPAFMEEFGRKKQA
jgi:tRNA nucleotidyltransferase (CCA-adding enzyme)